MSAADINFTHLKTLNLLLKQQVLTKTNNSEEQQHENIINFQQTIELNEQETVNKFPTKSTYKENYFDQNDDIKLQLGNIQVEESSSIEHHKTLCESYDLLENLLDHILQHVECVILEIKTSNKLATLLNNFATQKLQQETLQFDNASLDLSGIEILQEIKNKLYVALHKYQDMVTIRQEYERKEKDYHLALKNFKILLEVMEMNDECLENLKQQFHDVVLGCRNCWSLLEREIPQVMRERMEVLEECLISLGKCNKICISGRVNFMETMANLGMKLKQGHYLI